MALPEPPPPLRGGGAGALSGAEAVNSRQRGRPPRKAEAARQGLCQAHGGTGGEAALPRGAGALPRGAGAARPPPPLSPQETTEGAATQPAPADVTAALPPQRRLLLGGDRPLSRPSPIPSPWSVSDERFSQSRRKTRQAGPAPSLRWPDVLSIGRALPAPFRQGEMLGRKGGGGRRKGKKPMRR